MNDDPRCCGSGTCIIDADGQCWCGQRWDGQKMCRPVASAAVSGSGGEAAGAGKAPDGDEGGGSGDGGGD